jgi:tetratricopeptide (TPR) repeat protein
VDSALVIADPILRHFVTTGALPDSATERAAAEALDRYILGEVQRSLPTALEIARAIVRKASGRPGSLLLSAHRARARAALMSGRYAEAERAYLAARALAVRDSLSRGRIDRTLIDVYMYLGRFEESRRRARLALRTFRSLGLQAEVAKTKVNYANLLHRQDRHRDAGRLYQEAAEFFVNQSDELSAARCLFNRANTLVQLFLFHDAESLYEESERIYRRHNHELDAVDARWGISWLHMLQGRFHVALRELQTCETAYERIGVPLRIASCILDRAEVYLNLNLFQDARDMAELAEERFADLGIRYERAKAAYYRARAALVLGNNDESRHALRRARAAFRRDNNHGFLGAVHLLSAQATRTPKVRRQELGTAQRLFARAQLPLWQAVCDLQSLRDAPRSRSALRRLSRNKAAQQVPHFYAAWQTALGDLKARNSPGSAIEHWTRAADRLDLVRAQLPPIELRTSFGKDIDSPHKRLVDAEATSSPLEAAVWSERLKTAGIWAPPLDGSALTEARERVSRSLSELAGQVAALSQQIPGSGERSVTSVQNSPLVKELQRRVRQDLLEVERDDSADDSSLNNLAVQFGAIAQLQPIVQWHIGSRDILAFIHESSNVRSVRFPGARTRLQRWVAQWRFVLESAALADVLGDSTPIRDEHRMLDELGEWLIRPLQLPNGNRRLLMLPEGELSNIPWAAVRLDSAPLGDCFEIILSPSLRHHVRARGVSPRSSRVLLLAGPSDDLPAARDELDRLSRLVGTEVYRYDPCRRTDWPETERAQLWHYSGHAVLNRENPFYSSLRLADGPLFAADLRLRNAAVGLVTLAACQSGAHVALPGEEATGLVRSFLEMGARNVVAGHWPVADRSTALWMEAFYSRYFTGHPITESAHFANNAVMEAYPSVYHWAAFSVFGAGC